MGKPIILNIGERFGHLVIKEFIGNASHLCICDCGNECVVKTKLLRSGYVKSCGCKSNNREIDMTDQIFGEWHVLKKSDIKGYWVCRCSCGTVKDVNGHELRRGNTLSCGHNNHVDDLTNKQFGEWVAIEKADSTHWICECSCGNRKSVHQYSLISGKSKSCGCKNTKYKQYNIGDRFNRLTLLKHTSNQNFLFKCDCGNIKEYNINSVTNGHTKSCGCEQYRSRLKTLIDTKGDFKVGDKREKWQIEVLSTKDRFIGYLDKLDSNVSREEAATELGVTRTALYEASKRFDISLLDYIDARCKGKSPKEVELVNYIKSIYNGRVIQNTRSIISPQELDIYIPDKELAIEFNGSYWHSDLVKDKRYHQNKTLKCIKQGIRLIHIFEYEWDEDTIRSKLEHLLKGLLAISSNVIYGRQTNVKMIDSADAKEFLNKYHLQGYTNAAIHLGCYYNNKLIGVMTFAKPRFNHEYEYEIIRLCWDNNTYVVGGTEKLFKYFLGSYNPESIITYSDISKFTGNVYTRLGFDVKGITKPDYIWYNVYNKEILTRYQTQKSKLIKLGIAEQDDTEDYAMSKYGYIKIYNSGNLKMSYSRS